MASLPEHALAPLSPLEADVVQYFVRVAQTLGLPRSVGEIYGVVFCAREPLSLDEVAARLRISRGSASQGLRVLMKLGALATPYIAGERRTLYTIEPSIRRVVETMLSQTAQPFFHESETTLRSIRQQAQAEAGPQGHFLVSRVDNLLKWNQQAQRLLPWLSRLAGRERWLRLR